MDGAEQDGPFDDDVAVVGALELKQELRKGLAAQHTGRVLHGLPSGEHVELAAIDRDWVRCFLDGVDGHLDAIPGIE